MCDADANLIKRRKENKKYQNHFHVNQRLKRVFVFALLAVATGWSEARTH